MMPTRIAAVLIFCFVLNVCAHAARYDADSPCLTWDVKTADQQVNKRQARRLYIEAAHWLQSKFHLDRKPVLPCLTVHIGETCPSSQPGRTCVSPTLGDVYIPKWDNTGPALVAQATVLTGLLQLVSHQELKDLSTTLLNQDIKDFSDVIGTKNK